MGKFLYLCPEAAARGGGCQSNKVSMLFSLALILFLAGVAADWIHIRRHKRRQRPIGRWRMGWMMATDLLPVVIMAISLLSRDNGTRQMAVGMWLLWAWIATVAPRMACYLFRVVGLRRTGYVAAGLLTLLFLWGATRGRTRLHVSRVEVISERIPEAFDGFRIVQISDLHVGTLVNPDRELQRLADSINALHPDAVFFTGDLVNIRASELDARMMQRLQRINGPVWSVIGNHDLGSYIKDSLHHPMEENLREVIARQQAMGWTVLQDTTVYLHRGTDSIALTGLGFDPALRKQRHDRHLPAPNLAEVFDGVPASLYSIVLVHIPQLWEQIIATGYGDMTLSGHVHSMQMKLRPWGRGWSPASWLYTRWSGRYDEGRHTLYINDGIGYVAYPMRLGAWPEITLITLKRCA